MWSIINIHSIILVVIIISSINSFKLTPYLKYNSNDNIIKTTKIINLKSKALNIGKIINITILL